MKISNDYPAFKPPARGGAGQVTGKLTQREPDRAEAVARPPRAQMI